MHRILLVLVAGVLLAGSPLDAQTIRGRVVDVETAAGLGQVVVAAVQNDAVRRSTISDSTGAFSLLLDDAGIYQIRTERLGFLPIEPSDVEVARGELVEVEIPMASSAIALSGITVRGRRSDPRQEADLEGFVLRRLTATDVGSERIVVTGDPEMETAATVEDVLAWFPPARACVYYYIDGLLVDPTTWPVMEMQVSGLQGVEYYRSSDNLPFGFEMATDTIFLDAINVRGVRWGRSDCSVVAVWRTGG